MSESTYWDRKIAATLNAAPTAAARARILASELDEAAAVFRSGPFPITAAASDAPKIEAIRKVAQLARTCAIELRMLADLNGPRLAPSDLASKSEERDDG